MSEKRSKHNTLYSKYLCVISFSSIAFWYMLFALHLTSLRNFIPAQSSPSNCVRIRLWMFRFGNMLAKANELLSKEIDDCVALAGEWATHGIHSCRIFVIIPSSRQFLLLSNRFKNNVLYASHYILYTVSVASFFVANNSANVKITSYCIRVFKIQFHLKRTLFDITENTSPIWRKHCTKYNQKPKKKNNFFVVTFSPHANFYL